MVKDYIEDIEGGERREAEGEVEFREDGNDQFIEGYAIVYKSTTDIGPFTEEVQPGAADHLLKSDVRGLLNHDTNVVLGRTKSGTMELVADEKGLKYKIKFNPNDPDHVRVKEKIKRGDISQSSFGFTVKDDEWSMRDGKQHRSITKLKSLVDVSPVTFAAYKNTTVAMRSLNKINDDYKKDLAEMDHDSMMRDFQKLNIKSK
jgi:HK97 family phage prohead protease